VAGRLFARRRDGRIEVRLNDAGRSAVREVFVHVVAAERSDDHEWHVALQTPINPSSDDDDPLSTLARQNEIATNAELAIMTVSEQYLNDAEAWAWLSTLQVALRSTAVANGILSDERLESCPPEVLADIRTIQQFLFDLAACL
jgi:DNA-binding transcriptional regulator PaaX